jgi:hypothetical protein
MLCPLFRSPGSRCVVITGHLEAVAFATVGQVVGEVDQAVPMDDLLVVGVLAVDDEADGADLAVGTLSSVRALSGAGSPRRWPAPGKYMAAGSGHGLRA